MTKPDELDAGRRRESIRGVLFDMDGVLVDSEPLRARAWEQVLTRLGQAYAPDWFRPFIGGTDRLAADWLDAETNGVIGVAALLDERRRRYREIVERELRLFPGVTEGLRTLTGFSLALVSSSSGADVRRNLHLLGLHETFQVVIAAEDVKRPKPDPEAYLRAAERLGMPASACAALEDSPLGTRAARCAGCLVVGVTTTHPAERLPDATRLFGATSQAIAWIARQSIQAIP